MNRAQILWRCRRGMLELDLLLKPYAEENLAAMSAEQLQLFLVLLEYSDQSLLEILMGRKPAKNTQLTELANTIQNAAKSY
ncbi:MAG TPA: succinate dehydrogenase assembly factor 2 family protein [Gammaproteobacteria bacterium]|nr:succinate dehydrogenase assembly factor 2 family protein [Gammaproteobacteria bacterium]